jgi:anti-sigma factor RsiW
MSEPTPHLGDAIQDLLDGRLDAEHEAAARAHLAACDVCRQEWQHLSELKTRLRAMADTPAVPIDLEATIRTALDRESATPHRNASTVDVSRHSSLSTSPRRSRIRWAWAAGVAAVAMLAIGGGLAWWLRAPTPTEVADDYVSIDRHTLPLDLTTSDAGALEREFKRRGGVPTRVYDLGMMQYTLVGGRVHGHRGQPGTLAVYRGPRGELVICEMYFARPPSRAPVERRVHNGIEFFVYRRGDVTMVFWDERVVTCVLASTMDQEAVVQLAFAKAMRPS